MFKPAAWIMISVLTQQALSIHYKKMNILNRREGNSAGSVRLSLEWINVSFSISLPILDGVWEAAEGCQATGLPGSDALMNSHGVVVVSRSRTHCFEFHHSPSWNRRAMMQLLKQNGRCQRLLLICAWGRQLKQPLRRERVGAWRRRKRDLYCTSADVITNREATSESKHKTNAHSIFVIRVLQWWSELQG